MDYSSDFGGHLKASLRNSQQATAVAALSVLRTIALKLQGKQGGDAIRRAKALVTEASVSAIDRIADPKEVVRQAAAETLTELGRTAAAFSDVASGSKGKGHETLLDAFTQEIIAHGLKSKQGRVRENVSARSFHQYS